MYYLGNDTPAMARTSNLNEELGQVRASLESLVMVTRALWETSIRRTMERFLQKYFSVNVVLVSETLYCI